MLYSWVATSACGHQYGVEGTYSRLTNELYAIASNSNYNGHVTTSVEHNDVCESKNVF